MATTHKAGSKSKINSNLTAVEEEILLTCANVGDILSPIFGPKGLDKLMLYGDTEEVLNDPAVILDKMCYPHPIVKIIADAAETAKYMVGDGATTTALLASALVKSGMGLAFEGITPALIAHHYTTCLKKSLEILGHIARRIDPNDTGRLVEVASTALGKLSPGLRSNLAKIVVGAVDVMKLASPKEGYIDTRAMRIETKAGGSLTDSHLVRGVVLDEERSHRDSPSEIRNAKVALLSGKIGLPNPIYSVFKSEVRLSSPTHMREFTERTNALKTQLAEKFRSIGVNVVVTKSTTDHYVESLLAKNGVMIIEHVGDWDLECLMKATGAQVCANINDLSPSDLGNAEYVHEVEMGGDKMTFFECENPKSTTIVLRGNDAEKTFGIVGDALFAVRDALRQKKTVEGGGASEMEVVVNLKKEAKRIPDKLQLVMGAYADAVESVVATLCINSGLDVIDALTSLEKLHKQGYALAGVDADKKLIHDVRAAGLIHPLEVKEQAFISATEAAASLLRTDYMIQLPPRPPTMGEVRMDKVQRDAAGYQGYKLEKEWLET